MYPNGFFPPYYPGGAFMGMGGLGANIMRPGITSGLRGLGAARGLSRGAGAIRGIRSLAKGINWGGLLSNTQKTLGVVNQAIPIVKQAGPMFNNMKTMLKLASAFKDETDDGSKNNTNNNNNINKDIKKEEHNNSSNNLTNNTIYNNYSNEPNFFI